MHSGTPPASLRDIDGFIDKEEPSATLVPFRGVNPPLLAVGPGFRYHRLSSSVLDLFARGIGRQPRLRSRSQPARRELSRIRRFQPTVGTKQYPHDENHADYHKPFGLHITLR